MVGAGDGSLWGSGADGNVMLDGQRSYSWCDLHPGAGRFTLVYVLNRDVQAATVEVRPDIGVYLAGYRFYSSGGMTPDPDEWLAHAGDFTPVTG